jgi:hypothetical protein
LNFGGGNLLGNIHFKYRGDERIILMDLKEIGCEDGRRLELYQNHVQWWALS